MGEVKLIGFWGSPFTRRVEMALKLKGIEYEYIDEDINKKIKSPLLLKYNPVHKKVPVLLHNGKAIAESLIIVEYIDETWQGGLTILPKDPYERAIARFWAKFIDEKCVSVMWKACWSTGEQCDKAVEEAENNLNFLENEIKGKKFFGGDTLGLADFAGNFIAYWFPVVAEAVGLELLTEEKYPNLCRWIGEYTSCSIVKENVPPKDKMFAFFKARVQGTHLKE